MDIKAWAEAHPFETGAIVFGGGLVLLWAFGFFSSSSSTTSSDGGMAAAYYAAEAAQTQAGTALAITQSNNQAQTNQTLLQAYAATAINASNNTAAVAMNTTQYASATDIAKAQYSRDTQIATVQANDAMNTSIAANAYAYQTSLAGDQANEITTAMQTIVPQEIGTYGAGRFVIPGLGYMGVDNGGNPNINAMVAQGYDPAYAAKYASVFLGVPQ